MTIATGEQMLASDINDLTFFPKGAILTFSTAAYNSTSAEFKTIWKICNGQNGTPDLVNKFLRGGESSGAAGDGKKTLSIAEIPSHNHTGNTKGAGSHNHNFSIPRWVGDGGVSGIDNTIGANKSNNYIVGHHLGKDNTADAAFHLASGVTYLFTGTKNISEVSTHTHTVDIDNRGGGQVFDVVPAYYTVIYIMKIA
jgi:hypothetical protein